MVARAQTARTFWRTLRSVSVAEVAREADRPVSLIVVGDPVRRAEALSHLVGAGTAKPAALPPAFNSTLPEDGFPAELDEGAIILDVGGGRTPETALPVYSVEEMGGWERTLERLVDDRPDLALALARRYPAFRPAVSTRIINQTALTNAEFAMLNALPGVIPILAALLPVGAVGDIYMLTKNQAMMLFRLAAAHGLPLDMRARAADLGPLLGNALGWRALARELVGVVPGGVGLLARGAISYAGTAALGRALERYYATGVRPTRAQFVRFYHEAYQTARQALQSTVARLRSGRRRPTALPPGSETERALPAGQDADE